MTDKFETNNPILKTIQIVKDRIEEIMETGQVESNVTLYGSLMFYERLAKNLHKLYNGGGITMIENNLGYKYLRERLKQEKRIERFYRENKTDFFTWGCIIFGLLFLLIYGINF